MLHVSVLAFEIACAFPARVHRPANAEARLMLKVTVGAKANHLTLPIYLIKWQIISVLLRSVLPYVCLTFSVV